jgi:hypothetical protein
MTIDYDPISSLEAVGYLEREASFLYLVAVHSGYFLRRQYSRFAGRDGGTLIARFLKKADRHHHIKVIECGQGWHIYHLASQSLYAAIERPDSQNRRIKGDAYIKSRLMVLDFVLAHLSANILEDEASKVDFFTTQCGVRSELLPRSHARRHRVAGSVVEQRNQLRYQRVAALRAHPGRRFPEVQGQRRHERFSPRWQCEGVPGEVRTVAYQRINPRIGGSLYARISTSSKVRPAAGRVSYAALRWPESGLRNRSA